MWGVEVDSSELSRLLEIIHLFLPHHHHRPIYTLHQNAGKQVMGALKVELPALPDTHQEIQEEMTAAEKASGVKGWHLSAACSGDCRHLAYEIQVTEVQGLGFEDERGCGGI